jgi:hypothetical protein
MRPAADKRDLRCRLEAGTTKKHGAKALGRWGAGATETSGLPATYLFHTLHVGRRAT